MKYLGCLAFALTVGVSLGVAPAQAAGVCKTETLTCATTMPVGGYCECKAKGKTEDGDVVSTAPARKPVNATAGGCGANPNAAGCR